MTKLYINNIIKIIPDIIPIYNKISEKVLKLGIFG